MRHDPASGRPKGFLFLGRKARLLSVASEPAVLPMSSASLIHGWPCSSSKAYKPSWSCPEDPCDAPVQPHPCPGLLTRQFKKSSTHFQMGALPHLRAMKAQPSTRPLYLRCQGQSSAGHGLGEKGEAVIRAAEQPPGSLRILLLPSGV